MLQGSLGTLRIFEERQMARAIRSAVSFLGVSAVAGMIMFGCGGGSNNDNGSGTGGSKATGGKAAVGGTSATTTGITGGKTGAGGTSTTATGTKATGGTSASVGGNTAAAGGNTAAAGGNTALTTGTTTTAGGASAGGTTSAVGGSSAAGGASAAGGSSSAPVLCDVDANDPSIDPLYGTSIFCLPSSTNLNTVNGGATVGGITLKASAGTMTLKGTVTAGQANQPLSLQSPYNDCSADAGPDVSYGLNATDPNTNKQYIGLKLTVTNNRTDTDALLVVYLPDLVTAGGKTYYTLASTQVTIPKGQTITDKVLTWANVDMYKSDGTTLCDPGGGAFDPTHILGVGVGFGAAGVVDLAITQIDFTQ